MSAEGLLPHTESSQTVVVGIPASIFNFIVLVIGGGLLGWPNTFKLCGWMGGSCCLCAMCLCCGYTMCVMVNCAIKLKTMSYEETCCAVWGRPGYYIVALVCFLIDFGVLVAYWVAIGALAAPIASDVFGVTEHVETKVKLGAAVIMLPPSYLRSLGDVPGWSYISYALILFASFSMLHLAFQPSTLEFNKYHVEPLSVAVETNWTWIKDGVWPSLGTIAFTFVNHDSVFMVFERLKDGNRRRWAAVCMGALCSTTVLMLGVGIPIYLVLGDKITSDMTTNYPGGMLMSAVRVALCACIVMSWVYLQQVGRKYLHSLAMPIVHRRPLTQRETYHMTAPELGVFTSLLFGVTLFLGIYIQDLGLPMALTGVFAQSLAAFVIPPCLVFSMVRLGQNPGYSKIEQAYLAGILVFGLVSCTLGVAQTLLQHFDTSAR